MSEPMPSTMEAADRHSQSRQIDPLWEYDSEYDAAAVSWTLPRSFEKWLSQAEPFFDVARSAHNIESVSVRRPGVVSGGVSDLWCDYNQLPADIVAGVDRSTAMFVYGYENKETIAPSSGKQELPDLFAHCVRLIDKGFQGGLTESLRELGDIQEEVEEKQLPTPSDTARQNAENLLVAMYRIYPRAFSVYPSPEGDIVLEAASTTGDSLIVVCFSDGRLLCLVCCGQDSRRARYENAERLPDGFLREALLELAELESDLGSMAA